MHFVSKLCDRRKELVLRAEDGRVDREKEVRAVIRHRAIAEQALHVRANGATGEPTGEQIDHEGESVSLGSGGGKQHARDRSRGISGGSSLCIRGPCRRNLAAGCRRQADLAHRRLGHGHVENHGCSISLRHCYRQWVVAHHARGAAGRRHERTGVACGNAYESLLCRQSCRSVCATEVEGVPDDDHADAECSCLADGEVHAVVRGDLAKSVMTVEYSYGTRVSGDGGMRGRRDRARADALDVQRQHHHAVRGKSALIGFDEGPRGQLRIGRRNITCLQRLRAPRG